MRVFGLAGWSGAGKTSLVDRLVPALIAQGARVSSIKHAHHDFDIDQPGKDSWRHRQAGATEVLIASDQRWALMHELRGQPAPDLAALLSRMTPVDLVLVEGFKRYPLPKLEICRPSLGKAPLWIEDPLIIAVALDEAVPPPWRTALRVPIFDLNDADAIARFILIHAAPLSSLSPPC